MRILIAPDKFKGSLSAREVAENIALGHRDVLPDAKIEIAPMADGGEGTAEVICNALGGKWVTCRAHEPLGRRSTRVTYGLTAWRTLAVMEMSEAAGLRRLQDEKCDVHSRKHVWRWRNVLDAAKRGADEIIIGLGGSVTNDGGFGMARALGSDSITRTRN